MIRKIPVTAITFWIAVFAIAGFGIAGWGFSGFYSKDMILEHAAAFGYLGDHVHHGLGSNFYWLLFILPAAIAYVTPFYMMRCWTLDVLGQAAKSAFVRSCARDRRSCGSRWCVLALASIIGGRYMNVREFIEAGRSEVNTMVKADVFRTAWPTPSADERLRPSTSGGADPEKGSSAPPDRKRRHAAPNSATEEFLEHGKHTMHARWPAAGRG